MIRPTRLPDDLAAQHTAAGLWTDQLTDAYLARGARDHGDRVAVVDRDRSYTYRQLDELVDAGAAGLARLGVTGGDVVSWQLPNWVEAITVHHAAIRLGAVSNPIIPIYRHREVAFILRQSRAVVFVVPENFRRFDYPAMVAELRPQLPDLQHVVVVGSAAAPDLTFSELTRPADDRLAPAERSASDVALLLYTSGTTADPKGVMHTHQSLDYENRSIRDLWEVGRDDVVFMPSPVAHITGVLYGMQLPFMVGGCVVLQDIWEPEEALRLVSGHGCTVLVGATPFLHGLVHHPRLSDFDVSRLRVTACGGADVPPELIRSAGRLLSTMACRIYGSTEFPTLSGANAGDPEGKRAETDGRAIGAAEGRVVDEQGKPVGTGTAGELLVRGPDMFVGYLDADLNAEAFTDDGWFKTGDLAVIDGDGYVHITGRSKDIIIRGGENISAREVEDLLFEHAGVSDVAVVGMPDPAMVERICAYVVPAPGGAPTLAELVEFLRAHRLANQKLPERLELVSELPRTASGKIQKFQLRADIAGKLRAPPGS